MARLVIISCALMVFLFSCSACSGAAKPDQTGAQPSPPLAGLPALTSLDASPAAQRLASNVVYQLLGSPPVQVSPAGASYNPGPPATLSLTPPGSNTMAWAIFALSGLPTDGSAYPLQLQVAAGSSYWVAVSDYQRGAWRLLPYQISGFYGFADGAHLVSPASGTSYVALIAWINPATFTSLQLTTNQGQSGPLELWLYLSINLYVEKNLADAITLVQRAAAAGYTKVVLADFKLGTIDQYGADYETNLQEFTQAARNAGVEVIPSLVPIGYSDAFLCHDPNLIEPQPVVDCEFAVSGGTADVVQDPATVIVNGGFENHAGDAFDPWNQMDGAGASTFADTAMKRSGAASIRFENFLAGNPNGNDRIRQNFTVEPWHCYAVSFWLKTDNVAPVGSLRAWVAHIIDPGLDQLTFNSLSIAATQDWKQYRLIFNSQEYTSVDLYMGIWSGQGGRFWIDDVTVENTGLINLIRRPGAPLHVTNLTGDVEYTEGVDFEPVSDPLMGHAGSYTGTFDLYHARPVITLTPGSAINDGQHLLVDYYHCVFVYDMQPACCLTEPAVYDIAETTLTKVNNLIHPIGVFVAVDELRVVNWCEACQSRRLSPGELLAAATLDIDSIAHTINPAWQLTVWSDMYDPNHNAKAEDYYLANGYLAGSWNGLPANWDVANWNSDADTALSSLTFFADRGQRQILCGYYDEGSDYSIGDWLDQAKGMNGVFAVMYTTWIPDYTELEGWAQAVRDWEAQQP